MQVNFLIKVDANKINIHLSQGEKVENLKFESPGTAKLSVKSQPKFNTQRKRKRKRYFLAFTLPFTARTQGRNFPIIT